MTRSPNRLLIICHGIDGGVAPLASALAFGLKQEGWNCAVRYIGRPVLSKFVPIDQQRGIDSKAIATGKARSFAEVCGMLRSVIDVVQAVYNHCPDRIIFAGFISALLYPVFLRPFTKAKFILWDHNPQNTFLKIKKIAFPLSLKMIDGIVSISPSTASAMKEYFGVPDKKITIVPNGLDSKPWASLPAAPDLSSLKIIMPARMDLNQKDQITLIKAAAKLHRQGDDITITLVGSGIDEGRVRDAINAEAASDYIKLIGHSEDVPSLLAAHNVLCLSTKFEGLPTVLIEAMLARRIAVASRVSGCVDVIREGFNGFLFEAGNSDDCAAKLHRLINLDNAQTILDTAYRDVVGVYTQQSMIKNFDILLKE